jgi:hypothetical protein
VTREPARVRPAQNAKQRTDLLVLMENENRSGDETPVVPSEHLEVVVERKR